MGPADGQRPEARHHSAGPGWFGAVPFYAGLSRNPLQTPNGPDATAWCATGSMYLLEHPSSVGFSLVLHAHCEAVHSGVTDLETTLLRRECFLFFTYATLGAPEGSAFGRPRAPACLALSTAG